MDSLETARVSKQSLPQKESGVAINGYMYCTAKGHKQRGSPPEKQLQFGVFLRFSRVIFGPSKYSFPPERIFQTLPDILRPSEIFVPPWFKCLA